MRIFIATVKLPRNPDHDPRNKQTGKCRFSDHCTDVTGQHHSFLVGAQDEADARSQVGDVHLTRLEEVVNVDHIHERDHTAGLPAGTYPVGTDPKLAVLFYEVCVCGARRLFGNHPHGEWIEATP
jgi:hypothetical protein